MTWSYSLQFFTSGSVLCRAFSFILRGYMFQTLWTLADKLMYRCFVHNERWCAASLHVSSAWGWGKCTEKPSRWSDGRRGAAAGVDWQLLLLQVGLAEPTVPRDLPPFTTPYVAARRCQYRLFIPLYMHSRRWPVPCVASCCKDCDVLYCWVTEWRNTECKTHLEYFEHTWLDFGCWHVYSATELVAWLCMSLKDSTLLFRDNTWIIRYW